MTDRSEKNRKIAEALGWRFQDYHNGGGFWHKHGCNEKARNSSCPCGGQYYLPDFYASEEWNAMVLEAMPWADLSKQDPSKVWRCDALGGAEGPEGDGLPVYSMNRKTAICESFLKWKGLSPGHEG